MQTNRRVFCAGAAASALWPGLAAAAEPGVGDREIVIGQIIALSGPLAAITPDIVQGATAWFNSVNDKGGIHGRKVRLVTLDDGYLPEKTVEAARRMIEQEQAFALLNVTGTGNVAAVLPLLEKEGMPLFGPITGAGVLRGGEHPGLFHLRASYADEAGKIVQHLATLGTQRISVVYLDNGFGKDGLAGLEQALRARGMKLYSSAAVRPDAADVQQAVDALHHTRPEAIVLVTTGRATVEFIKRYNAQRRGMKFYALSVMGTQATLRALGADGVGVVVASVVPFPWNAGNPVAREFREAMRKEDFPGVSFVGFEAYLNARVLTEGLRRAGRNLTRAGFVAAMEGMNKVNFGGLEVGYGRNRREGSRFVELTMVGPGEKFMK